MIPSSCCTYCDTSEGKFRIVCETCSNILLCLECFSCGAEIGLHKRDHPYRIKSLLGPVIFQSTDDEVVWFADEEKALLMSVEHFGFGSWKSVAETVSDKTAEICEDHFVRNYVQGVLGKVILPAPVECRVNESTESLEDLFTDISSTPPLPPIELTVQEQRMLGYLPRRDDFERDYDNDAESIVSCVGFGSDEDELELNLKISLVNIYREKLRERARRRNIARDYGIVRQFLKDNAKHLSNLIAAQQSLSGAVTVDTSYLAPSPSGGGEGTSSKRTGRLSAAAMQELNEEKHYRDTMNPYAQFHLFAEHCKIYDNLHKAKLLRQRVKELIRYRRHGVVRLEDGKIFDRKRSKRDRFKGRKLQKTNKLSQQLSIRNSSKGSPCQDNPSLSNTHPSERPEQTHKSLGIKAKVVNQKSNFDGDICSAVVEKTRTNKSPENGSRSSAKFPSKIMRHLNTRSEKKVSEDDTKGIETSRNKEKREETFKSCEGDGVRRSGRGYRLLPGWELLAVRERQICEQAGLTPQAYITIKTFLIQDKGTATYPRYLPRTLLDPSTQKTITDYLRNSGWLMPT